MSERQRTILGVSAVAIILAVMFFAPWRVISSGDIKWGPLYRPPASYTQSYSTSQPGARYSYEEAEIAVGLFVLEIAVIAVVGGVAFLLGAGESKNEDR